MYILARLQLGFLVCLYFYLGVVKMPPTVNASFNDLFMHFMAYMVLMCAGLFTFPYRMYITRLFAVFFTYSVFIECVQFFLPYRSFSILDMFANAAGLLVGISLGLVLLPLFKSMHAYGQQS